MDKDKHPTVKQVFFRRSRVWFKSFCWQSLCQSVRKAFVRYDHWDVIPMTVCAHRMSFTYWERTKGKQYRCQLNIRSMPSPYIWRNKQSVTESCIKISSSWQNRQTKHFGLKGAVLQSDVSLKVKQHVCLQISVSSLVLLL